MGLQPTVGLWVFLVDLDQSWASVMRYLCWWCLWLLQHWPWADVHWPQISVLDRQSRQF
jgi:hypothetical protein